MECKNFEELSLHESVNIDGGTLEDVAVFTLVGIGVGGGTGAAFGGIGAIPGMFIGGIIGVVEGCVYSAKH